MRILVPIISWLICVPYSLFFVFAWGMSAFGAPANLLHASSYLWVAAPVLTIGAILLLLQFKRLTWLAMLLHLLPWNAVPWLSIVNFVVTGERGPWLYLECYLGIPSLVCLGAVIAIQARPLPTPKPVQDGLRVLGIATIAVVVAVCAYKYRSDSEKHRIVREEADIERKRDYERYRVIAPDPRKGPRTPGEWHYLGALTECDKDTGRLINLIFPAYQRVSPNATEALKHVDSLTSLCLEGPWAKDSDLQYIKYIKGLKRLALINTSITGEGFREIAELPDLEKLDLQGSPITDKSLKALQTLPRLRTLDLRRTNTTAAGRQSFIRPQQRAGRQIDVME
jgi:hypothetical protein